MTDREAVAMRPCPFCGGDDLHITADADAEFVMCECGCEGPPGDVDYAVAAWNHRAAMGEREVRVKPLDWNRYGEAKGGGAKYNSYEIGSEGMWNCICYPHEDSQYRVAEATPEKDAKAAAQADYERRIRSALEVAPREVTVAEAAREAYRLGFLATEEGYNAEWPFNDGETNPETDAEWRQDRDNALRALADEAPQ